MRQQRAENAMTASNLRKHWEMFERSMIPCDASLQRRREMKRAWLSGMSTIITLLEHSPEDEVEDDLFISNLCEELDEMSVEVGGF